MKILFTLISLLISFGISYSQRKFTKQIVLNRITINTPDSSISAMVFPDKDYNKVEDDKLYYWYKADKIRTTRGGYDGKLLHGEFKQFYSNLNLWKKGNFKKGLKTGTWKTWYPSGELQEITSWKKGQKNGTEIIYNMENKPVRETYFKNGILKGVPVDYDKNGKKIKQEKKKRNGGLRSLFEKNQPEKPSKPNVKKEKSVKTGRTTIISTEPPANANP